MTAQDNMNAALADFDSKFTALDTAIQQAVVDMTAAFNVGDNAAFQDAADKLTALSAKMTADTTKLVDADAALHPVTPPVDVPPVDVPPVEVPPVVA